VSFPHEHSKETARENNAQNLRVEIGSEPLEGSGFEIEPLEVT
jgi:hypothetical protein